jgi:predicted Fe-Mo cluster-binding NifX family protein
MKIAFPTSGNDLDATLDDRLGRAPGFLLVDDATGTFETISNAANADAEQGAGIQSAQRLLDAGAHAVVASHCGPKAFKVLEAAGIAVHQAEVAPLRELLDSFHRGELPVMAGPRRGGH